MILCVNLNAAIDKTVVVPHFHLNAIRRPQQVMALPGGKGCNVARALKCLGESPVVTGWVGGTAGQFIEAGLEREGIGTRFVHTDVESRTCFSILDPAENTLTELYEKGDAVPPSKITEFIDWFKHEVGNYSVIAFSGSLPPGVPNEFYSELIRIASSAHIPTLLDSSGEALRLGVVARPTIVKINRDEFEELIDKEIDTPEACEETAVFFSKQFGSVLVISLGANGAIGVQNRDVIRIQPPKVNIVSAVGSGDSLLAGIALGIARSYSLEMAMQYGVAAGTANAMTVGAGILAIEDFQRVLQETLVSRSSDRF